jgi:hypothetical protein
MISVTRFPRGGELNAEDLSKEQKKQAVSY